MITLQVNGKQVELERATPLLAYIEKLGVDPRAVAVEHNGTILERAAYETVSLKDGDTVEIVRMVGGGSSMTARPYLDIRSPDHSITSEDGVHESSLDMAVEKATLAGRCYQTLVQLTRNAKVSVPSPIREQHIEPQMRGVIGHAEDRR